MTTTKNRNRRCLAFALLGLLLTSGLWAQTNLNVTCVDPSGTPVRGAKVVLQDMKGGKPTEKKTSKLGLADFKKLEDGVYRISARAEGMAPALLDLLWLRSAMGETQDYQLTMKAGEPTQGLYFEDQTVLDRANQLTQDAVTDFGTEDFEAAEAKLRQALELYPSSPFVHQNLGLIALRMERWAEGESHLQKAADYMEIFGMLGDDRLVQARQQVLGAIQTIPLQRLAVEANVFMSDKNYPAALEKFEQMKKLAPDNPDVYYNIALAQAHADLLPGAKEAITRALELRPSDAAFAKLRDQIIQIEKSGQSLRAKEIIDGFQKLYNEEEYQSVIDRSKEALMEIPEESRHTIWRLLGRAQMKTAKYSDSIMSYRKSAELKPEQKAEILEELAGNLLNSEQYDSAFQVYGEFYTAAAKPADQEFYALGNLLSNKGKSELAGTLFKKVLEINPDHPDAHYSLGMHYFYDKNDRVQAKKLLERFIEIGKDESKIDNAKSVLIVMAKTQ